MEISKNEINKNEAQLYLGKAIALLNIADEISETISFVRIDKKAKIEDLLQ